ncbi:UPF0729 protein CG18508 [Hermetia illucens]|uniref:UPF0729 protein CG18508 n=1 Tax=Hermetia illucens TaxID=343691 RepID=UPI0018CC1847|nr:UPF0729 protein CG18508 [Hermetia illucens]
MVCVPCFIIPILLFIWHKFFQPILLRYWNPWEKKDADGNVIKSGPEFPFQCKGDSCPFPVKKNNSVTSTDNTPNETAHEANPLTKPEASAESKKVK